MSQKGFSLILVPIILLIMILLVSVGYIFFKQQFPGQLSTDDLSQDDLIKYPNTISKLIDETEKWEIYISKLYKFSFKIPPDYIIEESPGGFIYIKKGPSTNLNSIIEIIPENKPQASKLTNSQNSFKEFVAEEAKLMCAADGPNGSIYCDKVLENYSFTNKNELRGYQIYLNQVIERFDGNIKKKVQEGTYGPIVGFEVSDQTQNELQALFLRLNYGQESREDEPIFNTVVNSLKF